jgi:hypothetical protein
MNNVLNRWAVFVVLAVVTLTMTGCASYSVSEADIQAYLNDQEQTEQTIGLKGIAQAKVSFSDIKVGIGRVADDRINVTAIADAALFLSGRSQKNIQIDMNFSAVPYYNPAEGAIFLNNIEAEALRVTPDELGLFSNKLLIAPIVEIVGQLLSTQPVYRLDESDFKQSLVKKMKPELVIKDHKLVVDL